MFEKITLEHVRQVVAYADQHSAITNRECRIATGLGYDSAIKIFGALCSVGVLKKTGKASGTKYIAGHVGAPNTDGITVEHLTAIMNYVSERGSATSRECQDTAGVTNDTSVRILAALRSLGMLRKEGQLSNTKYSLPMPHKSEPSRPGYHRKTLI